MGTRRAGLCGVVVATTIVVAAACSSSTGTLRVSPVTTSTIATLTHRADVLAFREVLGQLPYGTASGASTTCKGGAAVTPPAQQTATAQVILADRTKSSCYALGPVLLTGSHVGSVQVVSNETTGQWDVNLHFDNDDFVTKVAGPEVGRNIAIVVNGVVESAPTINQGITGQDVTISGSFDKATALRIGAEIAPAGTSVVALPPTPPVTRPVNAFTIRCTAFAHRVPTGTSVGGFGLPVSIALAAFGHAHEPVPALLARADPSVPLALCYFMADPLPSQTVPTCPNGLPDLAALASPLLYAVDAQLNGVRLPPIQDVFPAAVPSTTAPACK